MLGQQSDLQWTPFVNLSNSPQQTSEPKIVADVEGSVHVVWTDAIDENNRRQTIFYTRWQQGQWTHHTDVLMSPDGGTAWVTTIEVDHRGLVHVVWIGNRQGRNVLYYSQAPVKEAMRPQDWSSPSILAYDISTSGWAADLLEDTQGRLHLVYGSRTSASLYHMVSTDGGLTWSEPQAVADVGPGQEAVSSTMLRADRSGRLHVVWTARQSPQGWPGTRAFYARSLDGGLTWSEALLVDSWDNPLYDENRGPFFLSVGTRGADEVHLAWAGAPNGDRWNRWSSDGGNTWTPSGPIFGDRFGTTGFLDMAEDSAGVLHLFTTFGDEPFSGKPLESTWQGDGWSNPQPVSTENVKDCENPRVAIALGNEIHLVCVEQSGAVPSDVFHSWRIVNAPGEIAQSFAPRRTRVKPTITQQPSPYTTMTQPPATETPRAVENDDFPLEPGGTSANPSLGVIFGILPAALVVLAVLVLQLSRRRLER